MRTMTRLGRIVALLAVVLGLAASAAGRHVEASEATGAAPQGTGAQQVMPVPPGGGSFSGSVTFSDSGFAMAVYRGSIDDLETSAGASGATGVWVQDSTGRFQLLPVRGPVFLRSGFAAAFPAPAGALAFPQMTAVTLVR